MKNKYSTPVVLNLGGKPPYGGVTKFQGGRENIERKTLLVRVSSTYLCE